MMHCEAGRKDVVYEHVGAMHFKESNNNKFRIF